MSTITEWNVFTGPPSSGKTTTLEWFKRGGYRTSPDVSRYIIALQMNEDQTALSIREDQEKLQKTILQEMIRVEGELPHDKLVFLDYALPDNIAFCNIEGLIIEDVLKAATLYRYKNIFLFEPLEMVNDDVRTEDVEYQVKIYNELEKIYNQLGYKPIIVKRATLQERISFLLGNINNFNQSLQRWR